ncbi:PTS sugar transporter subunit IIA [Enterococcus malodoratus]|uniref:PTS system, glucose subfamily, IIA component n=1 Tax=Enterococcus malodoratus ATCC 43197 TaxID=1158601 RepID=R2QMG2_9ENTE|nr:PTS glucose transporter subunit IIA [Enterococcus malodoratus]EOH72815.1 PTS system, glucose subfamily, IIA component [Enterococcus malodoratus ATCC 43197]EOT67363.1 hypothetical protein I585_02884 [Enterococcus malodoratus ATCC 43197]OJG59240.1 PTS system, glucose subfamily, IIA component [Enterococcus malodoratus]SPX03179.1 PTS system, beta-glucoside-specific IIA, IIB, IIC component [Enterococcus malodoratus]STD69385.1 PTS system, beta-glucoside-specific IIA, IIB, IIC component [Enterococ
MTELVSIATGELIELRDVQDEVFSEKMLGDGFGIITKETSLYSPVSGTVSMVYDTGHAIGIQAEDGSEILIHIGIDTVELAGEAFDSQVRQGDRVDRQTVISKVDWEVVHDRGFDETVLVISLNKQMHHLLRRGMVVRGSVVAEVHP